MGEKEGGRLDSDYSGKPLRERPTASEVAASSADAPRPSWHMLNNDMVIRFEDGAVAVRGNDRKWYIETSVGGELDLSQPVDIVNDRWERRRKGPDGRWYIVADGGKLDLNRPIKLVDGRWVEVSPE